MKIKMVHDKPKNLEEEILNEIFQFHGTSKYWKHWTNLLVYTDGVKHLAERAEAYWLIDAIASYQTVPKVRRTWFQFWFLTTENQQGLLEMVEDEGVPPMVSQKIEYTDFPISKIHLYLTEKVLMLPNEY